MTDKTNSSENNEQKSSFGRNIFIEKHMKNKESIDKNSSKIIVIKKMKIYRNRSKKVLGKWLRDSNKMLRV